MFIRIRQGGVSAYLESLSNIFDGSLVIIGILSLYVFPLVLPSSGHGPHLLKLLRMFRIMRLVRLFRIFYELQIIMQAFIRALQDVAWVGLLTFILNYICAVFLTQTIGHSSHKWGDDAHLVHSWFGCVGYSMRTLFILITLSDWDDIPLTLSKQINGFIVFSAAIAYICATSYAMVSLITGMISESLISAQREDEFHRLQEIEDGKKGFAESIRRLLADIDSDNSGTVTKKEIRAVLKQPENNLLSQLSALDIDVDIEDLLGMIDKLSAEGDPNGEVPINLVANAMCHLSGIAKASSVWDLSLLVTNMRSETTYQLKDLDKATERIEGKLDRLCALIGGKT